LILKEMSLLVEGEFVAGIGVRVVVVGRGEGDSGGAGAVEVLRTPQDDRCFGFVDGGVMWVGFHLNPHP
jgi:hypothetical protein